MNRKSLLPLLVMVILAMTQLNAQEKTDTTMQQKPRILTPWHRNTIKFNPTPMLLQMVEIRNITLSYERMIKDNMSITAQAGYLVFPRIFDDTIISLVYIKGGEKRGINLATSFRYYPFQRNVRPAPDGLYLGGYLSYYGYGFHNDLTLLDVSTDPNGTLDGKLAVVNLGFELGYQFIFWKRFSVDFLLFGPSFQVAMGKLEIKGDLTPEQIADLDEEMVAKLLEKFPILNVFFSGETMTFTGSKTRFGMGFRYNIQLGFHF